MRSTFIAIALLVGTLTSQQSSAAGQAVVVLKGHQFQVDVMETVPELKKGLSGVTSLPDGHGMLFVVPNAHPATVWMKDTLIPLDILFFDIHGHLINFVANAPPCKADPCPYYFSTSPARFVLEVNAGVAKAIDINRGDMLLLKKDQPQK